MSIGLSKLTGACMGLAASLIVGRAHASPAMDVQCESLGPSNDVCIFADAGSRATVPSLTPAAPSSKTIELRMALADDLKGGAVDIENDFAAGTVLADATEVTESNEVHESLALEQAFRAQSQVATIQNYLQAISGSSITGRVSAAGQPGH